MAKVIRITSKVHGFRRCGIAHSKTPTDYKPGDFTKEQLAALRAEPNLVVEEAEVADVPPAGKK